MTSRGMKQWWLALAAVCLVMATMFLVWSASPLLPGAWLLLALCAGLLHQHAARRATDERLRDREAWISMVVDGAVDAIMTVDTHGAVASFNPAAERMFGWPSTEIFGQHVSLLFTPEPGDEEPEGGTGQHEATRGNLVREGGREVMARRRDGSSFPMHLHCREAPTNGPNIVTAIARDMTEYRKNAEALELAKALLETKVVELEERTRVITLLGQMSDHLQAAVSFPEAYASIAGYAQQLFPRDAGALCAAMWRKGMVEVVATWGEGEATRPMFAAAECRALRSKGPHTVDGDCTAGTCEHLSSSPSAGYVCLPILCQGEPLGIVHLRWSPASTAMGDTPALPGGLAAYRTRLAAAFTDQVALALTNIRLKEMLREQAIHDPLTGLHNRRYLEDAFHRELLRAARKRGPVGVLMLDLDHFKEFNDAHGHAAGDALLRALAVQLQSDVRAEDIACRYGGEEFAVILPDVTLLQAHARAEQIRGGLRKVVIDFQGERLAGVSVSIGVAALPEHGVAPDALLRAADAALYIAKAEGRDRTKLAAPILPGLAAARPHASARARD